MSMYRDVPFDGRFVVANPGPQWTDAVAKENGTFGDIIVLDHIAEDDITANTVKTLEFYKWLVYYSPRCYEFVSKMDTDTYDLVFPQGAMYTATWDMVALLVSLQAQFKVITGEDVAIAVLLLKAREQIKFVNFRGTEKFDFDEADTRGDGTAWARPGTHPNATYHALMGSDPMVIHQLKSEK
ncbi:hypothetical protein VSDG_07574 [Cytospora chrysosperma]|uniref:Hexosyltransferase n=1 Tax=Cytospora chrysosperma TaxID=252740 RepID=A0A423VM30_CYTCH|nr:hypothetical protein VSDG_07574 [Valsa sordida]